MGKAVDHVNLARQEKNNFLAVSTSPHGNVPGMVSHASLTVEHVLKALVATKDPNGETTVYGHNLGGLLQMTERTIPPHFERLVYDLDGMYTNARYDNGFSTGVMRDPDHIASLLSEFINYANRIVAAELRK